ncbi:N-acetyltransferase eso1 [Dipsacomyces acuminosporus]|nr:N-acetyltransferase eso1 [Dipsacomyces acuminosporus]
MTVSSVYRPLVVEELARQRAIIHIDLDASVPLAVQQWQGLIAVNYPAREKGVKRMDTPSEARDKCPDIRLVHVPTFTEGTRPAYHTSPRVSTHKVSLDAYRRASRQIMDVIKRLCPTMLKASIDEAYLDVTAVVKDRILRDFDRGAIELTEYSDELYASGSQSNYDQLTLPTPVVRWSVSRKGKERDPGTPTNSADATELGVLVGGAAESSVGWPDLQLKYAAEFAKFVRAAIFQELGYRCSAGIAHNMMLAKIGSALNKPNQQTIFCQSRVQQFMQKCQITSIPTLGGKFGAQVESVLDVQYAGDVAQYSVDQLGAKLGPKRAQNLHDLCRGIDTREVTEGKEPQSLLSAKNFGRFPIPSLEKLEQWLSMNGTDLWMRVMEEWEIRKRWPRSLTINYVTSGYTPRSKTVPFPPRHLYNSQSTPDAVVSAARTCFAKLASPGSASGALVPSTSSTLFPLARFSLQANGFQRELANASIMERFLSKSSHPASAVSPTEQAAMHGSSDATSGLMQHSEAGSHYPRGAEYAGDVGANDGDENEQSTSDTDSDDYPPPHRQQFNECLESNIHQQLSSTLSLGGPLTTQVGRTPLPSHHSNSALLPQMQQQQPGSQFPSGYGTPKSRYSSGVTSAASTPSLVSSHGPAASTLHQQHPGSYSPMAGQNQHQHHHSHSHSHSHSHVYSAAHASLSESPASSHHPPPLLSDREEMYKSDASSEYETTDSEMSCLKTPQESDSEAAAEEAEGGAVEGEEEGGMDEDTGEQVEGQSNSTTSNATPADIEPTSNEPCSMQPSFSQPADSGNAGYNSAKSDADYDPGPPSSNRSAISSRRRNNVYIQPNVDTQSAARYGEGYRHMDIDRHDDGSLVVASPEDSQSVADGFIPALIAATRRKREIQIFKFQHAVDVPEGAIASGPKSESNSRGTRAGAVVSSSGSSNRHSRHGSTGVGQYSGGSSTSGGGGGESSFMASVRSKLEESTRAAAIAESDGESSDDGSDIVLDVALSAMMGSITSSHTVMQIRCPQCPEAEPAISSLDWETHRDWHIAKLLQERELRHDKVAQQFRRAFGSDSDPSETEKPPAKRQRHDDGASKKKQSTLANAWK